MSSIKSSCNGLKSRYPFNHVVARFAEAACACSFDHHMQCSAVICLKCTTNLYFFLNLARANTNLCSFFQFPLPSCAPPCVPIALPICTPQLSAKSSQGTTEHARHGVAGRDQGASQAPRRQPSFFDNGSTAPMHFDTPRVLVSMQCFAPHLVFLSIAFGLKVI